MARRRILSANEDGSIFRDAGLFSDWAKQPKMFDDKTGYEGPASGSVIDIAYPKGHPLHDSPKDTDYFAHSDPYGVNMARDTSDHPGQTRPYNPKDKGPIRNDTINDQADYEIRGDASQWPMPDKQDRIPGVFDQGWAKDESSDKKPTILTRGFQVNVNKLSPALRDRLVGNQMGRGTEGLFPATDVHDDGPGEDFGSALLKELRSNPGSVAPFKNHQGYQLGRHWSTNDDTPLEFAGFGHGPNGMHMPVSVTAEWNGLGEDPANHGIPGEDEIMLRPGTKMRVREMTIQHPSTGKIHDVSPREPEEHVV